MVLVILILFYREWKRISLRPATMIQFEIPEGFKSYGIDVSHHQGEIDWELLFTSGDSIIDFVYCKATEGLHHVDSEWQNNQNGLKKRNIKVGAYHFFLPNKDPIQQANHFLMHYNHAENYLPPVIDVELETDSDTELVNNVILWLDCVEKKISMRPIVYTSHYFYQTKFKDKLHGYKYWIANYNTSPPGLEDTNIIFWQFTDKGHLEGINEDVDLNYSKILF